jgi:uncharacterized protein involved in exopolysaccharide biosynthesis
MSDIEQNQDNIPAGKKDEDDEISLIDLFAVLWRRRVMIIAITLIAMIGVVVFSVFSLVLPSEKSPLPNQFSPRALMLINNNSASGGQLSSLLASSGVSNLSGLLGISGGGATYSQLATYLVGTNSFLDTVVDEFDLIDRYEIKKFPRAGSRKVLKKNLKAEYDEKSGVFSVSFTDIDPVFAQRVVNFCVEYLDKRFNELGIDKNKIEKENLELNISNTYQEILRLEQESHNLESSVGRGSGNLPPVGIELNRLQMELDAQRQIYTQLKIQYEMLKVTMASETPVFQILEYAEVPDMKSGPSRGLICVVVTFAAGFFSVFLAFVLNAVQNIKNDPGAVAKFRKGKDD